MKKKTKPEVKEITKEKAYDLYIHSTQSFTSACENAHLVLFPDNTLKMVVTFNIVIP